MTSGDETTLAFWPSADIEWTEDGYRLTVNTDVTWRVLATAVNGVDERLTAIYGDAFAELAWFGPVIEDNTLIQSGRLEFVVKDIRLLNPEPETVRAAIEEALRDAQTTVDGLQQLERTQGSVWLDRLRGV